MRFKQLYINRDHYYSVGIDEDTGDHMLAVVITWVAWYSIYFRLTHEEVILFRENSEALTELSYEMASEKGEWKFKDRLVLNEGPQKR